eukprot:TRINITY_DN56800_c0_g1_i1.p1 TRINITY_DN56800_c0_g1~~TRINITY_DN56800_c0_g1_i1.p1  ORF type:complete len:112 (-),score=16.52 TRINITY_DN56800_c0_g1_i1:90-398(-)
MINVDATLRSFLQRVRLADNKDERSVSSEVEGQPQQQIPSQSKVQQDRDNLPTEPKTSAKPQRASHWSKMSSQIRSALQMVRSSGPSRVNSFTKIFPEPIES